MSAGEFLDAAASYLGLDRDAVRKSEVFSDGGDMVVAFELRLAPKDIKAIVERMSKMVDEARIVQSNWGPVPVEIPSYEEMVREPISAAFLLVADERVRERAKDIQRWAEKFDNFDSDTKAKFKSRFGYTLYRARECDKHYDKHGRVTSNADDFGGMPG